MLFARKLLAPGPQPKHPGNVNPVLDTGPPAEPGVYQNEIIYTALWPWQSDPDKITLKSGVIERVRDVVVFEPRTAF